MSLSREFSLCGKRYNRNAKKAIVALNQSVGDGRLLKAYGRTPGTVLYANR
jgi:hypothetical protein